MINLKSADRIEIKTFLGPREVKGEIYKGFGINKGIYSSTNWMLTVITGTRKGVGIAECRKKNDCRLLADEIIKKINKTNIEDSDIDSIRDIIKKYRI